MALRYNRTAIMKNIGTCCLQGKLSQNCCPHVFRDENSAPGNAMELSAGAEARRDLWNMRGQFVPVFLWRQTVLGPQLRHEYNQHPAKKTLNSLVEGTKSAGAQGDEPWSGKATSPLVCTSQEQLCWCPGLEGFLFLLALWECFKICALLYCSRISYKRLKRIILIMGKKFWVGVNKKTACIGTVKAKRLFRLILHSHNWNKGGVS